MVDFKKLCQKLATFDYFAKKIFCILSCMFTQIIGLIELFEMKLEQMSMASTKRHPKKSREKTLKNLLLLLLNLFREDVHGGN